MDGKPIEFFGKKDLKGFSYYMYLPKLPPIYKHDLSQKIHNYQGVYSFFIIFFLLENYISSLP